MSHQSLILDELLDALQFLSSNGSGFAIEDCLGDFSQARDWFARSAAQQYRLALSRLVDLQFASAA